MGVNIYQDYVRILVLNIFKLSPCLLLMLIQSSKHTILNLIKRFLLVNFHPPSLTHMELVKDFLGYLCPNFLATIQGPNGSKTSTGTISSKSSIISGGCASSTGTSPGLWVDFNSGKPSFLWPNLPHLKQIFCKPSYSILLMRQQKWNLENKGYERSTSTTIRAYFPLTASFVVLSIRKDLPILFPKHNKKKLE